MAAPKFRFTAQGDFINGRFERPSDGPSGANGEWVGRCPGDFSDEIARHQYSYAAIDSAVGAARAAFKGWRKTSATERAECLNKYKAALKKREDELTEAIAREVGKPLWEAKTEVATMVNKVDVTLAESLALVEDRELPAITDGTHGAWRHKPLGVVAVIGPFNFPGHLPNGHIVPAIATGNTVVFKPSEKAPIVAQLVAECFAEAGLPPGVFNVVQGEKETGRRLCIHEGVDGVLFTGSYEVGTRIKQDTLQQHWKLLALEMGGKNAAIVWEDADLNVALYETLTGAFVTAGQRCSATSRIIVHRSKLDEFLTRFHERAKAFSIGHPLENPFMGPLIEQGAVDRYQKFLGIAAREGCEIVMRGKSLEMKTEGNYVAPSICWVKEPALDRTRKSIYQQTEMFAPNVAILGVETIEDAIEQANATQFGLVCSVFTKGIETYRRCYEDLAVGLVNWNRSTVGASSKLPFGGLKKSGNHFPTAVTASRYCTYPVACLEVAEPKVPTPSPGLNWV